MTKKEKSEYALKLLKNSELTNNYIAEKTGLTPQCLWRIRKGKVHPSNSTSDKLIQILGGNQQIDKKSDNCIIVSGHENHVHDNTIKVTNFDERKSFLEQIDRLTRIIENLTK